MQLRRIYYLFPAGSLSFFALCPIQGAEAANCYDNVVCVDRLSMPDGSVELSATNTQEAEIFVTLTGEIQNGSSDTALPRTIRIAPSSTAKLAVLRRAHKHQPWRYQYGIKWNWGDSPVEHSDRYVYRLPFPSGRTYRVSQGYNDTFSHGGKHAVDFPMPIGSEVLAARGGTVVAVQDGFKKGGGRKKFRKHTNFILIQHDDRTVGSYCHIDYQGAQVKIGQKVEAGELLALSGNTGFSVGPHLHFHVATPATEKTPRTFPVQFYEANLGVVLPVRGAALTAP